jgi:hypothetical protein
MVRRFTDDLVRAKHLKFTPGHGPGQKSRYDFLWKPDATPDESEPDLFPDEATETSEPQQVDEFEEWWRIYPRHVAKGAARRAFEKAVRNGATVDELKAGAMRYAAERSDEDPKFTKHASTWLNGECWRDEPAERDDYRQHQEHRSAGGTARPRQHEPPRSHLEVALGGMVDDDD